MPSTSGYPLFHAPKVNISQLSRLARSASLSAASLLVANLVSMGDPRTGISTETDLAQMAEQFPGDDRMIRSELR